MKYNVIAVARKDKKNKEGLYPIYLFIYSGSKLIAKKSLGHKVTPENWDPKKRQVKRVVANATLINSRIKKEIADVEASLLSEFLQSGTSNISLLLRQAKVREIDFFEFADTQLREKKFSPETRRNRILYADKIKAFRVSRGFGTAKELPDNKTEYKTHLKLHDVDYKFLQQYESYLRTDRGNADNTVWGSFKFIASIINDAIRLGYIQESPFKTYKRPKYRQTTRAYLTQQELKKLEDFASGNAEEGLRTIATQFLFMAYTGLRHGDAVQFRTHLHVSNNERIVLTTKKSQKETSILINNRIARLLPFITDNPVMSTNQDFNRKLKIIAAAIGINKNLTAHVARHTFGASLVDLNVPIEVARELLTHSNSKTTKIYYHLKKENLDAAMKKFDNLTK